MLREKGELREAEPLHSGRHGDPAVFNLVATATPWVIGVIGLWLLKPRKGKTTRRKISRMDSNGQSQETEIFVHEYVSESPSEAVIKALSQLFGFGSDSVKKAIEDAASEKE